MRWGRLATENYRGVLLPRGLGIWLASCAAASPIVVAGVVRVGVEGWGTLGAVLLVGVAGLVDDLFPVGPRGLRNHLRHLFAGHVSTGLLKLLVAVGASAAVVALQPRRGIAFELAGVLLLAASTNLWNGLDVAPGRALKAFLPVAAVVLLVWPSIARLPYMPGLAVGAAAALPFDLRERAMLGDGGSNLLGFAAGVGLFTVLPDAGVVAAALIAAALNVLADTITLSRLIDASPPLRWVDSLGRLRGPS
jgi:UDP-GlcNAc:undecaprenyl-phosphate GlcNAc-1-phosphate transferase